MSLVKVFGTYLSKGFGFLFRLVATGAANLLLSNGTTYNSGNSDFVLDGDFTVVDSGNGTVQILNGQLAITPTSTANEFSATGGYTDLKTCADGRGVFFTHKQESSASTPVFGINDAADIVFQNSYCDFHRAASGATIDLYPLINGSLLDKLVDNIKNEKMKHSVIVDKTNGAGFLFIKGITIFTSWTLMFVAKGITWPDNIRGFVAIATAAGGTQDDTYFDDILIPDIEYVDQITPSYNLTDETPQDTYSDIVAVGDFTAVTGQTLLLDYRRSADGNDAWRVKVAQGSSNNVTLHKVVSGVESATLAVGSATINNGVNYQVQTHHQDNNYHQTYIDGVLKLSYTSTDSHQQAAIGTKLTLGTISTVDIGIFERDTFTFEGVS